MPIIRNRADLVLAAVMKDNPDLGVSLSYTNCWVYKIGSFSNSKGFCTVKGKWGEGARAKRVVQYHKLDLGVLLQGVLLAVRADGKSQVSELLPAINNTFGFDLTVDDIVDQTLTEGGRRALLQASPQSNFYKGSVELWVHSGDQTLSAMVTERNLAPALEYWPVQGALNGSYLSIGHDYTLVAPQLSSIQGAALTEVQTSLLVSTLASIDGVPWTGLVGSYSLKEAQIVYNGSSANTPAEYQPLLKGLFNSVLVLKPNTDYATNLAAAPIAFHYNYF